MHRGPSCTGSKSAFWPPSLWLPSNRHHPGACYKCRISGPTLDLLSQNLHINKIPLHMEVWEALLKSKPWPGTKYSALYNFRKNQPFEQAQGGPSLYWLHATVHGIQKNSNSFLHLINIRSNHMKLSFYRSQIVNIVWYGLAVNIYGAPIMCQTHC